MTWGLFNNTGFWVLPSSERLFKFPTLQISRPPSVPSSSKILCLYGASMGLWVSSHRTQKTHCSPSERRSLTDVCLSRASRNRSGILQGGNWAVSLIPPGSVGPSAQKLLPNSDVFVPGVYPKPNACCLKLIVPEASP